MALHHLTLDAPTEAARPAPSLWLARLALSDFRNYAKAELSFDGRPVVLFGANGAGKTNLLEALSLLAPGRGLRRARMADLARQGSGGAWAVAGEIETPLGRRQLGTGLEAGGGERRQARLDGESARGLAAFAEVFDLLWLTPQMDALLREGSSERRRFLDRLVFGFDPAHAGRVMAYETALRERARLLADGRLDEPWLAGLEAQMAERAVAIAWARRLLVQRLSAACLLEEGPFPKAGLALSGSIDSWLDEGSALDLEERLKAAWRQSRAQDAASGQTEIGVHRGDLKVTHLAKGQPAALSSTGEQKALLLSIVLAHSRLTQLDRGRPPILLLDEVAAHLDEERRLNLFQTLLASGAQAFLTGTDPSVFEPLGRQAQFFAVADGSLRLLP